MDQVFDVSALRVAKPCSASWAEMTGDDRERHCQQCKKSVYNVAGLTRDEVARLVQASGVMPCLRLARRADGTVVTKDCPVGVARLRQKAAMAALACLAFGFTVVGGWNAREKRAWDGETMADHLRTKPVIGPLVDKVSPAPNYLVGEIACPPSAGP